MEEKLAIQVDGRADYLVSMMLQQAQLENKIYEKAFNLGLGDLTSVDKCQFIKDCVHWVTEELHEMTRELPFMKHWKNYNPTKEEYDEMVIKAKKEYIDAFHFIVTAKPDRIYTISHDYYTAPTPLALYSDVPAIPETFKEVIVAGGVYYAYMFRDNAEQAAEAKADFTAEVNRMRRILIPQQQFMRTVP